MSCKEKNTQNRSIEVKCLMNLFCKDFVSKRFRFLSDCLMMRDSNTGRARLIRSHPSARIYRELSGNSNFAQNFGLEIT